METETMATIMTRYNNALAPEPIPKRPLDTSEIQVHDLRRVVEDLPAPARSLIVDVWHLAHDLLNHIREEEESAESVAMGKASIERGRRGGM
jgi:hypothetical protein